MLWQTGIIQSKCILVQSNIVLYLSRQKGVLYFGSQQLLKKKKKGRKPQFCIQVRNLSPQCSIFARRLNVILVCKQGILNISRDVIQILVRLILEYYVWFQSQHFSKHTEKL